MGSSWISGGAWYLEEVGTGRGGCAGDGDDEGGVRDRRNREGATGMRESHEGKVDRMAEASEREGGDFGGAQGEDAEGVGGEVLARSGGDGGGTAEELQQGRTIVG